MSDKNRVMSFLLFPICNVEVITEMASKWLHSVPVSFANSVQCALCTYCKEFIMFTQKKTNTKLVSKSYLVLISPFQLAILISPNVLIIHKSLRHGTVAQKHYLYNLACCLDVKEILLHLLDDENEIQSSPNVVSLHGLFSSNGRKNCSKSPLFDQILFPLKRKMLGSRAADRRTEH